MPSLASLTLNKRSLVLMFFGLTRPGSPSIFDPRPSFPYPEDPF